MNNIPAGAGQQAALAQLPIQEGTANATALNSAYQSALGNLTQIGSLFGSTGLQEAGAGLSGLQGAASTTSSIGNQQAQGKASTMGFLGELAGAGAKVGAAALG